MKKVRVRDSFLTALSIMIISLGRGSGVFVLILTWIYVMPNADVMFVVRCHNLSGSSYNMYSLPPFSFSLGCVCVDVGWTDAVDREPHPRRPVGICPYDPALGDANRSVRGWVVSVPVRIHRPLLQIRQSRTLCAFFSTLPVFYLKLINPAVVPKPSGSVLFHILQAEQCGLKMVPCSLSVLLRVQ